MKCQKCNKKAEIILKNLYACKNCFMRIIEKRVRREIRQNHIKKDEVLVVIDDNSPEAKLTYYFLKKILPYNKIIIKNKTKIINANKIILPVSADDEGEYLLKCAFENKKPINLGNYEKGKKQYIKLLLHIGHDEVKIMADLLGLKYKDKKYKIITKLNELFPDAKFGLVRSVNNISKIKIVQK